MNPQFGSCGSVNNLLLLLLLLSLWSRAPDRTKIPNCSHKLAFCGNNLVFHENKLIFYGNNLVFRGGKNSILWEQIDILWEESSILCACYFYIVEFIYFPPGHVQGSVLLNKTKQDPKTKQLWAPTERSLCCQYLHLSLTRPRSVRPPAGGTAHCASLLLCHQTDFDRSSCAVCMCVCECVCVRL